MSDNDEVTDEEIRSTAWFQAKIDQLEKQLEELPVLKETNSVYHSRCDEQEKENRRLESQIHVNEVERGKLQTRINDQDENINRLIEIMASVVED